MDPTTQIEPEAEPVVRPKTTLDTLGFRHEVGGRDEREDDEQRRDADRL